MREDGVHQFFLGGLEVHRDDEALDQLGDFRADQMGAQQLAGLGVEDRLRKPRILAERDRLAVGDEVEATDLDLVAGGLCLRLGQADAGDLRVAIGAARDHQLVHGMRMQPLDRLDADHRLVLGLVGQHRRAGDVADRVNALHIGPAEIVDDDAAAIGLHAERLEPDILDIADHADSRDHPIGGDRLLAALLVLDMGGDGVR